MIVLNCLIGMCLSLLLLIFQLSVPCLAAYILSRLGIVLLPVERRKPNFRCMLVLCLLLVFGGLALLFYHPIVSCRPELQDRFTPEMREEAMAINQGFYSAQVPLQLPAATRSFSWKHGSAACLVPASSSISSDQKPGPTGTFQSAHWLCPG